MKSSTKDDDDFQYLVACLTTNSEKQQNDGFRKNYSQLLGREIRMMLTRKWMAVVAIVRFLKERIPQAWFAFDFAQHQALDMDALVMVYASIAFSLAVACKSCLAAITHFVGKMRQGGD